MKLTDKQRNYLSHMLGAQSHVSKSQWGYRNRFCAGVGSDDEGDLKVLAEMGLVTRGAEINGGQNVMYHATEAGMDAIGLTAKQKKNAMED